MKKHFRRGRGPGVKMREWGRGRHIKYLMAKSWRFIHSARIVITSTMLRHNYWSQRRKKRSIIVITHCFGKQKATPLILIMISCRLFVTANTKSRWRWGGRDNFFLAWMKFRKRELPSFFREFNIVFKDEELYFSEDFQTFWFFSVQNSSFSSQENVA